MHALLVWLATKKDYQPLSMAQLLHFLKSPYIKQQRKFVLKVERILREAGLSLFESKATVGSRLAGGAVCAAVAEELVVSGRCGAAGRPL
jgi:hypothetical protein